MPLVGQFYIAVNIMKGYSKFFGTEAQQLLPVRSAVEVAALANPGWLIEIEVSAARP